MKQKGKMKNDALRRLPPPPLFTIRPPPKPPGSLFENFQTVKILNGQCVRSSLDILSTPKMLQKEQQPPPPMNWLNIFLLILALISVICCIIIAIFIFICLKKLRKEEKQYKNYVMSGSLSSKHRDRHHPLDTCTRTSEHYKCTSNTFNCCDDYYSHQLIPMTNAPTHHIVQSMDALQSSSSIRNVVDGQDTPQNHQYECIPEYLLTMTRRHHQHPSIVCHHHSHRLYQQTNSSTCGAPYMNFSRLYLTPQEITTTTTNTSDSSQCTCSSPPSVVIAPEESSIPLLSTTIPKESHRREEPSSSSPTSLMIGWTRRNSSSTTKRKPTEQRRSFLSQLRKSSFM